MIACPSSRKLVPGTGGSSSSSSIRATSRCRKCPAGWYHSRSQCVWATTSTRRGDVIRGVWEGRDPRTRRPNAARGASPKAAPRERTPRSSSDDGSASGDQAIDDYDQSEDEQQVDQAAADMEGERAECPQDEENDRKSEEHGVHPRVRE